MCSFFEKGACKYGDQCQWVRLKAGAAGPHETKRSKSKKKKKDRDAETSDDASSTAATAHSVTAPARTTRKRISFDRNEVEICEFDPAFGRNIGPERWIADTRCGDDLIGYADLTPQDWQDVESLDSKHCLYTANGTACFDQAIALHCEPIREIIKAVVMKSPPTVIAVGRRCLCDGWAFHWEPGANPTPSFRMGISYHWKWKICTLPWARTRICWNGCRRHEPKREGNDVAASSASRPVFPENGT